MGVTSEAQICNMALDHLGARNIVALTDDTPEAEACSTWYAEVRDDLLRRARWPWAVCRAELSELSGHDTTTDDVWDYVYGLPTDCLRPLEIWPGTRSPADDDRIRWALEWDRALAQNVLCTDEEDAVLIYLAKIEVPLRFPTEFVDALSWALAAKIALPLTKDRQTELIAIQNAERTFALAAARSANVGQPEAEPDDVFSASR